MMKLSFILIILFLIWQGIMKGGGGGKGEAIPAMAVYGSYYDDMWERLIVEAAVDDIWPSDTTLGYVDSTLSGWKHLTAPVEGISWDTIRVNDVLYYRSVEDNGTIYRSYLFIVNDFAGDDFDSVFVTTVKSAGGPRVEFELYTTGKEKELYAGGLTTYYLYHYLIPNATDSIRLAIDVNNSNMKYEEYEVDAYVTKWTKTWTSEEDRPRYPYRGGIIK